MSSGSAIATGTSVWSMFISLLRRSRSTIVSSLMIASATSTLPTTSPSWRWTLTITVVRTVPVFHRAAGKCSGRLRNAGLMDFYKCYRAYVRGKVESVRQGEVDVSDSERRESRARAERYFRLALQYAVCGSEPRVVVLMGRVGSGKSTLASALGQELGWDIFSSDQARKELAGLPLYTRGGPAVRRRLYSKATTRKTYAALLRNARNQVKERRSLILDATFSLRHYRDQLRQQLDRAGVAYCFVEAHASEKTSRKRLEARERKAHEVSDARLEDFEMLNRSYEPPLELDLQHRITVGTEHSLEATVAETLKALTECKG